MIRKIAIGTLLVLLLVGLRAFAGGQKEGSAANTNQPTTINLYTSEALGLVSQMVNDFMKTDPAVKVRIFRSGTGPVVAKLQAEMQANDVKADVIWFADIAYFHKLASEGKLMTVHVTAPDVPAKFRYEGGKYWEVRQIFNVIAYNTLKVKTPPTSWSVLTNPEYKGKVGMPSPAYSGAAFTGLATLTQTPALGWKFYQNLAKNNPVVEQGNGSVANKLASGEFEVGTVVGFMIRNLKVKGSPVNYVWPKQGAVLIPTPVGVLASTKHPQAASAFINYLLSTRGQKLFVKQGYIPVRPNMGIPKGVPSLSKLHVLQVNVGYMSGHHDQLMSRFQKLFQ